VFAIYISSSLSLEKIFMEKLINLPERKDKKRVVIVGGGFAGLKLARRLSRKLFQVVLIDINNYHQFQPLFYQVATSGLEPSAISFPYRKIFQRRKNVHFRLCRALQVIPERNVLETTIGALQYDYLVIATGCSTNFFGKDNLQKTTFTLKTISDALAIRNCTLQHFEQALIATDEKEQQRLLNFVIVGGGATGVELAGAFAEMREFVLPKDYPELDFRKMKIYIVDALSRLLNVMSPQTSGHALKYMKKLGVEVLLDTRVEDYNEHTVILSNGLSIPTYNVFWVGGIIANSLAGFDKNTSGRANRIRVNEFNQVAGHDNIFALGDTALMKTERFPDGHPQVAPVAVQQSKHLSANLRNLALGKPLQPFLYKNMGTLATIGRNRAVAEFHYLHFSGFIAWAMWLFIHLMSIVGVKNRLFIFLDWMWNYFTYDQSLRLLIKTKEEMENEK
jgi:NADH:ubiquinone reductase (H+-translocating)